MGPPSPPLIDTLNVVLEYLAFLSLKTIKDNTTVGRC
jgi:hypothetical protein